MFRKIQRKAARATVSGKPAAKYRIPPDATIARDLSGFDEASAPMMLDVPAPAAGGRDRSEALLRSRAPEQPDEPIDLSLRALAAFAAMEQAFARFSSGLSPTSLATLTTIK